MVNEKRTPNSSGLSKTLTLPLPLGCLPAPSHLPWDGTGRATRELTGPPPLTSPLKHSLWSQTWPWKCSLTSPLPRPDPPLPPLFPQPPSPGPGLPRPDPPTNDLCLAPVGGPALRLPPGAVGDVKRSWGSWAPSLLGVSSRGPQWSWRVLQGPPPSDWFPGTILLGGPKAGHRHLWTPHLSRQSHIIAQKGPRGLSAPDGTQGRRRGQGRKGGPEPVGMGGEEVWEGELFLPAFSRTGLPSSLSPLPPSSPPLSPSLA